MPHGRASIGLLLALAGLQGCAQNAPHPWQKDLLARPAMAMETDPLERANLLHIYGSKENSSGGEGVGGGGCGCN